MLDPCFYIMRTIRNKFSETCIVNGIKKLSANNNIIIAGPWLSEVGFEVLYWIPFLNWLTETYNINKERIVAVSRGGTEKWYANICKKYIDVFDYFSENEFKEKNKKRIDDSGGQKHNKISGFDLEIMNKVKTSLGCNKVEWLHPELMYNIFTPYWRRESPISVINKYTIFKNFSDSQPANNINLPDNYVAVKFYFSPCFPDTEKNRLFIKHLIEYIAVNIDVVLLSTGLNIDDHSDYNTNSISRIHNVSHLMTARNNLDIQTYILSKARAFIGTYGGFSYLAPFCNTPSIAFYSNGDKFLPVHMDVAHRAMRVLKYGVFDKTGNKNTTNSKDSIENTNIKSDLILMDVKQVDLLNILIPTVLHEKTG